MPNTTVKTDLTKPYHYLTTPRLQLVALTISQLQQFPANSPVPMADPTLDLPVKRAIALKQEKMAQVDPSRHGWYTYWLLITEGVGLGLMGFKGQPNSQGEVEIGYGIASAYRNQGYTTEAAHALISWAFQHPSCQAVVALKVLTENLPSQRVLQKLGFQCVEATATHTNWRVTHARFA